MQLLFDNQQIASRVLGPGDALEVPVELSGERTVTLIGVACHPEPDLVLEQDYRIELTEHGAPIPLASKDSLRGVVVTTLTHTCAGESKHCVATIRNTGRHDQSLSLLVAIA